MFSLSERIQYSYPFIKPNSTVWVFRDEQKHLRQSGGFSPVTFLKMDCCVTGSFVYHSFWNWIKSSFTLIRNQSYTRHIDTFQPEKPGETFFTATQNHWFFTLKNVPQEPDHTARVSTQTLDDSFTKTLHFFHDCARSPGLRRFQFSWTAPVFKSYFHLGLTDWLKQFMYNREFSY